MKYSFMFLFYLSIFPLCEAGELVIPNHFSSGTTISSSEMNDNFSAISENVNSKDARISKVESSVSSVETGLTDLKDSADANGLTLSDIYNVLTAVNTLLGSIDTKLATTSPSTVSDQLICFAYSGFPTSSSSYKCIQASDPTNQRSMTFVQVMQEGWRAVSVGGGDWATFIFNK